MKSKMASYADRVYSVLSIRFSVFELDEPDLKALRSLCDAYGYDIDKFERTYQFSTDQFIHIQKARDQAQLCIWRDFALYLHSRGYSVPIFSVLTETWDQLHKYCNKYVSNTSMELDECEGITEEGVSGGGNTSPRKHCGFDESRLE